MISYSFSSDKKCCVFPSSLNPYETCAASRDHGVFFRNTAWFYPGNQFDVISTPAVLECIDLLNKSSK